MSGVSTVATARFPMSQLTRTPERSVDAAVLDGANMGADGIVGVDLLRSQRVQFDFEKQTMSIVPSAAPDFADEPGTIVVRAQAQERAAGRDRCDCQRRAADRGPRHRVAGQHRQRGAAPPADSATIWSSVAEAVELESVTGQKIIGDYMFVARARRSAACRLSNLAVVFADAHTFKQLRLDGSRRCCSA